MVGAARERAEGPGCSTGEASGAGGGIRTHKASRPADFKSAAFASSATPAGLVTDSAWASYQGLSLASVLMYSHRCCLRHGQRTDAADAVAA